MVATTCLALALLTWISMTGARLLLTLYAIEFGAQPFTVGMLIAALQVGKIAGAGLDVFEHEPNVPEALFGRDDVVLLPHIASSTRETRSEMGRLVIKNLEAWFTGKPLVTPTPETLAMLANR